MRRKVCVVLMWSCFACGRINVDGNGDDGDGDDASSIGHCEAPDVMVLLDRTMSMHKRPDGTVPPDTVAGRAQSKWSIAVAAVEELGSRFATSIRFGLTLFPRDPGSGACVTQSERIGGASAKNKTCEGGEVVVTPALATDLASLIDPDATLLCNSTPIGAGLATAGSALAAIAIADRDQYVVFLGDGRDTCNRSLAVANAHSLAAAGVRTFVVGFDGTGGGIDKQLLADLACAGHTATGFPTPCTDDGSGNFTATDRDGPPLYLHAEDATALAAGLNEIAGGICCGCLL